MYDISLVFLGWLRLVGSYVYGLAKTGNTDHFKATLISCNFLENDLIKFIQDSQGST